MSLDDKTTRRIAFKVWESLAADGTKSHLTIEDMKRVQADPDFWHAKLIRYFKEPVEDAQYDWPIINSVFLDEMFDLLSDSLLRALDVCIEARPEREPDSMQFPFRLYLTQAANRLHMLSFIPITEEKRANGIIHWINESIPEKYIEFRNLKPWVATKDGSRRLSQTFLKRYSKMNPPPLAEIFWPMIWVFHQKELIFYRPVSPLQLAILLETLRRDNIRSYDNLNKTLRGYIRRGKKPNRQ